MTLLIALPAAAAFACYFLFWAWAHWPLLLSQS